LGRRDLERARYYSADDGQHEERDGNRPEVVGVGAWFRPFATAGTWITRPAPDEIYPGVLRFTASVMLDPEAPSPLVAVQFRTIAAWTAPFLAFTPFHPERGYRVTSEDLDGAARLEKTVRLSLTTCSAIEGHPLILGVFARALVGANDDGDDHGAGTSRGDDGDVDDRRELTSRLRLQVAFPTGLRLQAHPEYAREPVRDLSFCHAFYPLDTGPLPVQPHDREVLREGLQLALPPDGALLAQMEARFLRPGGS
jgi:hypothetical protein